MLIAICYRLIAHRTFVIRSESTSQKLNREEAIETPDKKEGSSSGGGNRLVVAIAMKTMYKVKSVF